MNWFWAPHISIGEDFSLNSSEVKLPERFDTQITLSRNAWLAYYAPSAAMFRSKFLDRVGDWNESLERWVDLEYHARIAAVLPYHARLNEPLYFYRQHGGERISNSNRNHSNIDSAIKSLTLSRSTLEASKISPTIWKSSLSAFYLQLARSSAISGDQKLFLELMQEAAALRGSPKFQLKCYLAMISVQVFWAKVNHCPHRARTKISKCSELVCFRFVHRVSARKNSWRPVSFAGGNVENRLVLMLGETRGDSGLVGSLG